MRHGVEHHAEYPQRTGKPVCVQRRIAEGVDPRKVGTLARTDAHLRPQRVQVVRKHLSDAAKAHDKAGRTMQRDACMLHRRFDRALRRWDGVAHAQLLCGKIVRDVQPQRVRERHRLPAHVSGKDSMLRPQRAEKALGRQLRAA